MTYHKHTDVPNFSAATSIVAASDSLHPERADYVCAGSGDQDIMNAAHELGDVQLMQGTYYIDAPIILKELFCSLNGVGHSWESGGTRIFLENNSDCNMIEMDGAAAHIFFPTISNLYLGGNGGNQASGNGIYCDSADEVSDQKIFDVGIQSTKDAGIRITSGWLIHLNRVWCEYCLGRGALISKKCSISNSVFGHNFEEGIRLGGEALLSTSIITNNHKQGIYCSYTQAEIANCLIKANSEGNTNVYAGVTIHGDADYISLEHNIINGGSDQKYGIELLTGVDYVDISHNTIYGNATKSINLAASVNANGQIKDNIGYVNKNFGSSTGTGAQQTIAHGLADTPTKVMLWNIEAASHPYQSAAVDSINIYVTAGNGLDWGWEAEV